MSGIRDEDKQHSHHVTDGGNVVQYARYKEHQPHINDANVRRSPVERVQYYIDHAGRPTVVKEANGRTDVFVGDDQITYFPDGPAKTKWGLVQRAEMLADRPWREASHEFRELRERWNPTSWPTRSTESALWPRFKAAQDRHFAARTREQDQNRAAKEGLVSQAESLAHSSDLRSASDQMRKLGVEWKRIGPCERSDNDRLWSRFNQARNRLNERKKQEFEKRQREWTSNKAAKQRLVSQMESLANSSDFRAAKDQARALDTQWRATGPCSKTDNDQLWQQYKSAKDRLFEAAKRAGEQRRAEARQRAQDRVWRLEERLRNVEDAIRRAEESYSRALSARSPSMRNPNWMAISNKQLARQSAAREKVASLGQRKADIMRQLMEARARLNQF